MFRFFIFFILLSIFQCPGLTAASDSPVGEIMEQLNPDEGDAVKDIPSDESGFVLLEERETSVDPQEHEQKENTQKEHTFFQRLAKIITDIFKS